MNQHRNDDRSNEDTPPYSRIFVVCSKDLTDNDLRAAFEKYGSITSLYMPKNRNTGESRGVAYIKYEKTSSAAAAIQDLHKKTLGEAKKPVKVMIATSKNDNVEIDSEKINRLFIKVAKDATDAELKEYFSKFGSVQSVYIQKDRNTQESKGLAYIQFDSFLDTAKAFEECDQKYKAVFATPKQDLKRSREGQDFFSGNNFPHNQQIGFNARPNDYHSHDFPHPHKVPINTPAQNFKTVIGTCTPILPQIYIEKLFNIVPGMTDFHYNVDKGKGLGTAVVTYEDERAAAHAVERLNNYEFPSGELLSVKPDNPLSKVAVELTSMVNSFKNAVDTGSPNLIQLADAIAQASNLIKQATTGRMPMEQHKPDISMSQEFSNVALPNQQPLAPPGAPVVQRCFIVCKPTPPPYVLKDIFCRFGNLIDVSTLPSKTYGYAKYATEQSAQNAIATLHGAIVFGSKFKVMEADEKPSKDNDNDMDSDGDSKRMRLNNRLSW